MTTTVTPLNIVQGERARRRVLEDFADRLQGLNRDSNAALYVRDPQGSDDAADLPTFLQQDLAGRIERLLAEANAVAEGVTRLLSGER
jgi:hypothetical protein